MSISHHVEVTIHPRFSPIDQACRTSTSTSRLLNPVFQAMFRMPSSPELDSYLSIRSSLCFRTSDRYSGVPACSNPLLSFNCPVRIDRRNYKKM
ncbi:conserved hypothetical protein [Ricinus communis]|uniref:Uncharacterized protein n=1 Tax=Ricinus communis TaxID=3988 RepID=B9SL47_RICCO|nr:conserved hypothetical protein [Ricinus communis]